MMFLQTSHENQNILLIVLLRLISCAVLRCSVVSDSLRPHGLWPTRLLCPWALSRQEYWSGLSCHPPWGLLNPGIEPRSKILYCLSPQGSPG